MKKPVKCLEFGSREQWRTWLTNHHATQTQAWLIIYKKKFSALGITLGEAVEEALCFGWIDSTMNSLDEKRYALRFSPRKSQSIWSMGNIRRAEKLIAEGKMTEAGQQKIEEAKANVEWDATIRREQVDVIPEALEAALRQHEGALAAYRALPDSRKKQYIYWLQRAKREETKQRRIQKIVDEL
jgi:uncharacterized protein YdeI (YjbR/CyaY-like superfamily)